MSPATGTYVKYSIIAPVYQEQAGIRAFVDRIFALPGSMQYAELLLVDGGPEAATLDALYQSMETAPPVWEKRVRPLVSPAGRGRQMNEGAKRAKGSILLFLHADTHLPADALPAIEAALSQSDITGGAFSLSLDSTRPILRMVQTVATVRSRLTRVPFGDQAIFVRRSIFDHVGGFPEIPIMEDVAFMLRLKQGGHRIRILPQKALTSARRIEHEGLLRFACRNQLLRILFRLGVSPDTLARAYRPHGE